MERKYFCAYHSYLEAMEQLTDVECGRLFRACLLYSRTGEAPKLTGNERFVFPGMKSQIDRDRNKYKDKCEKNRRNGSLGGKATASERQQPAANAGERPPNAPRTPPKEKEKEKDKEREKEKPSPPTPQGEPTRFDAFWTAYPKKVGKDAARKAYLSRKPTQELHQRMLAAIAAQKQGDQWTREGGRFIPNPATWLNQGRWEDEVPKGSAGGASKPARASKTVAEQQYTQREYDPTEYEQMVAKAMEEASKL